MNPGQSAERIPAVLWISVLALTLMIIGKIASSPTAGPWILVDAFLSAMLLFGIVWGQKWAYVLTILFVAVGVVSTLTRGSPIVVLVIVADLLVLLPVLFSTRYFFPHPPAVPAEGPIETNSNPEGN